MREFKVGVYVTPSNQTRYTVNVGGFEVFNTDSADEVLRFIGNLLKV